MWRIAWIGWGAGGLAVLLAPAWGEEAPIALTQASPPASASGPVGQVLQLGGFGVVLGSQAFLAASSERDVLLAGGVGLFAAGTLALLLAPPEPPPSLLELPLARASLAPSGSPVPVWAPPSAIQALKRIQGLSIQEGVEVERVTIVIAAPVLRYDDRTVVAPGSRSESLLTWLADAYRESGRSVLTLVIHVSPSNDPEADRILSQARAEALKSFCTDREGIPSDRVIAVPAGSGQPLVPPTHPDAEKINARVEAVFQRAGTPTRPSQPLERLLQAPGVQVRRELEAFESVILASEEAILFDVNSARWNASADAVLERIAGALKEALTSQGRVQVVVEGHTDAAGNPEYNKRLSFDRALSVVRYFTGIHRMPEGMFRCIGFGSEKSLVANDTPEHRMKNRRVTIRFSQEVAAPRP